MYGCIRLCMCVRPYIHIHGYTYARPGGVLLLYSLRSPAEGATTADRQTVAALFFPKPRKDRHFARKSRRVATLCVPEDLEPLLFLTKSTHCCPLYSFSLRSGPVSPPASPETFFNFLPSSHLPELRRAWPGLSRSDSARKIFKA